MHRCLRRALLSLSTLAFVFLLPLTSWASGGNDPQYPSIDATSSSYYLQNDPRYNPPRERGTVSIQTQTSQKSQGRSSGGGSDYKLIKRKNKRSEEKKKQAVKRISLSVLAATFAASTFRASLRKSRIVRTATPFGRIRNASPLGNGVSVLRVCMALGFDENNGTDDEGVGGADSLLRRLHLEEKELYSKMELISQHEVQGGNKLIASSKQKARGEYLSNVASTFLQYRDAMRYASLDSIRVPFAEEAAKAFRRASKEERKLFSSAKQSTAKNRLPETFVVATILLAIKGDRTSVQLPFGVVRRRDAATALSRIATDAKVDDCLVGSELLLIPRTDSPDRGGKEGNSAGRYRGLTREEILKSFPELVPLT